MKSFINSNNSNDIFNILYNKYKLDYFKQFNNIKIDTQYIYYI